MNSFVQASANGSPAAIPGMAKATVASWGPTTVASVPVILEKINGLDRMMTRDLDEVKHALRNIAMASQSASRRKAAGTA